MQELLTATISMSAYAFILRESEAKLPTETGGILIGRVIGREAQITHVSGPGPKARHDRREFIRDGLHTQSELDALYQHHMGQVDYLGEWHSHPKPGGPSKKDIAGIDWISKNPSYCNPNPLLLICERRFLMMWRVHVFWWNGCQLRTARLVVDRAPTNL